MHIVLLCLSLLLTASPVAAQEALGLAAPAAVIDSGFLSCLPPRFSLRTSIRVRPDPQGAMVLATTPPGRPVFQTEKEVYCPPIAPLPMTIQDLEAILSFVAGMAPADVAAPLQPQ